MGALGTLWERGDTGGNEWRWEHCGVWDGGRLAHGGAGGLWGSGAAAVGLQGYLGAALPHFGAIL